MSRTPGRRSVRLALVVSAWLALYAGWRAFWFLTDDAYIAFRYVSNRQLGHGYVWNAAPFLPVEGYTSFLWVVLLDVVWSVTGLEPPESANLLSLGFAAASVALCAWMLLRMPLGERFAAHRTALLGVVLLGLVTNTTFLTWASSGLETAAFNFLFLCWVAACLSGAPGSPGWTARVAATAAALMLTRPDGALAVLASGALLVWCLSRSRLRAGQLLAAAPLAVPGLHLLWRKHFYGEWLPNTYHAKLVAPWPESGVRYALSYLLEFGLWAYLALALAAAILVWRGRPLASRTREPSDERLVTRTCVTLTVLLHVAYYTLVVGGDHFEYRIYSFTVPLVLLSAVWLADRLARAAPRAAGAALAAPLVVVAVSWPIPWTYYAKARTLETRQETYALAIPMAPELPPGLRSYAGAFDDLQRWLVAHAVGRRHREHAVFAALQRRRQPGPRQLGEEWTRGHPVYATSKVGVPGWLLPHAHVIDTLGLNDYVIARTPVRSAGPRRMAHDRSRPPGYLECFEPNVDLSGRAPRIEPRRRPLTDRDIAACEERFRARLANERT